jgi:HSF-type DNA-binding
MCVGGRRLQPISSLQQSALNTSHAGELEGVASAAYSICNPNVNIAEKVVPKRRRKPQKPGKTAKNNDRHFVVHHYHDHAQDVDCGDTSNQHAEGESSSSSDEDGQHRRRGGVSVAFPVKLHEVLDQVEVDGFAHIISWQEHGRCFMIHKPKEFVDYIMPRYCELVLLW